jgi:hypothetical protein
MPCSGRLTWINAGTQARDLIETQPGTARIFDMDQSPTSPGNA